MAIVHSRRGILARSLVMTAGAAVGAFTPTGLAAMSRTLSEQAFIDRFDRQLDAAEIRDLVVGNTMEGVTFKGGEFLAYVAMTKT